MILISKGSGTPPTVTYTTTVFPPSIHEVGEIELTYLWQNWDFREQVLHEYDIVTNADVIDILTPDYVDASEWPKIKTPAAYKQHYDASDIYDGSYGMLNIASYITFSFTSGGTVTKAFAFPYHMIPWVGYTTQIKTGTLFYHAHNLIYTAATQPAKSQNYYRTVGGSGVSITAGALPNIQPNPDCWAAGWDFSGVPVWNSSGGTGGGPNHGGAMITSRHLLEAKHYASPVGSVLKFMQPNGTVTEHTVVGEYQRPANFDTFDAQQWHKNQIPPYVELAESEAAWANQRLLDALYGDRRVLALDPPVPPGIKKYSVVGEWLHPNKQTPLPLGWTPDGRTVFVLEPGEARVKRRPFVLIYLNQNRNAKFIGHYLNESSNQMFGFANLQFDGISITALTGDVELFSTSTRDVTDPRSALTNEIAANPYYSSAAITGDSGSPAFYPLSSSEIALVGCFYTGTTCPTADAGILNLMIARADADALTRNPAFNGGVSTGYTVIVAPDPTL